MAGQSRGLPRERSDWPARFVVCFAWMAARNKASFLRLPFSILRRNWKEREKPCAGDRAVANALSGGNRCSERPPRPSRECVRTVVSELLRGSNPTSMRCSERPPRRSRECERTPRSQTSRTRRERHGGRSLQGISATARVRHRAFVGNRSLFASNSFTRSRR